MDKFIKAFTVFTEYWKWGMIGVGLGIILLVEYQLLIVNDGTPRPWGLAAVAAIVFAAETLVIAYLPKVWLRLMRW